MKWLHALFVLDPLSPVAFSDAEELVASRVPWSPTGSRYGQEEESVEGPGCVALVGALSSRILLLVLLLGFVSSGVLGLMVVAEGADLVIGILPSFMELIVRPKVEAIGGAVGLLLAVVALVFLLAFLGLAMAAAALDSLQALAASPPERRGFASSTEGETAESRDAIDLVLSDWYLALVSDSLDDLKALYWEKGEWLATPVSWLLGMTGDLLYNTYSWVRFVVGAAALGLVTLLCALAGMLVGFEIDNPGEFVLVALLGYLVLYLTIMLLIGVVAGPALWRALRELWRRQVGASSGNAEEAQEVALAALAELVVAAQIPHETRGGVIANWTAARLLSLFETLACTHDRALRLVRDETSVPRFLVLSDQSGLRLSARLDPLGLKVDLASVDGRSHRIDQEQLRLAYRRQDLDAELRWQLSLLEPGLAESLMVEGTGGDEPTCS